MIEWERQIGLRKEKHGQNYCIGLFSLWIAKDSFLLLLRLSFPPHLFSFKQFSVVYMDQATRTDA